jgi:hypothetical protein
MSGTGERVMWFDKDEGGLRSLRRLVIFDDGSACIEEDDTVEIGFEEAPDAWCDAIQYLRDRGYSECPPPGGDRSDS